MSQKIDYTGVIRPMTKADKAVFLHDLRTTAEPQGRGQLESDVGFCCLGRANKCLSLERPGTDGSLFAEDGGDDILLPYLIQKKLYELNDKERKTFPEIADYIEQNIPAVDEEQP